MATLWRVPDLAACLASLRVKPWPEMPSTRAGRSGNSSSLLQHMPGKVTSGTTTCEMILTVLARPGSGYIRPRGPRRGPWRRWRWPGSSVGWAPGIASLLGRFASSWVACRLAVCSGSLRQVALRCDCCDCCVLDAELLCWDRRAGAGLGVELYTVPCTCGVHTTVPFQTLYTGGLAGQRRKGSPNLAREVGPISVHF